MNEKTRCVIFFTGVLLLLPSCLDKSPGAGTDIAALFEQTIRTIENPADKRIMLSSNADDYIKYNQSAFDNLVAQGRPMLDYLLDQMTQKKQNGFREYVMVRACCAILGEKNPVLKWTSPRKWFEEYLNRTAKTR